MRYCLAVVAVVLLVAACQPVQAAYRTTTYQPPETVLLAPVGKTTGCSSSSGLPDPGCTPGATDPRVTQANLNETICSQSWTKQVRPPVEITESIKRERMAAYGLDGRDPRGWEVDHLVPLELGGHPTDAANLWPQVIGGELYNAKQKDGVENRLHRLVCNGHLSLAAAQQAIAHDWRVAGCLGKKRCTY